MEKLVEKGLPLWVVLVGWVHVGLFVLGEESLLWGRDPYDDLTAQIAYFGPSVIENFADCQTSAEFIRQRLAIVNAQLSEMNAPGAIVDDALRVKLASYQTNLIACSTLIESCLGEEGVVGGDDSGSLVSTCAYSMSAAPQPHLAGSVTSVSSQEAENRSALPRRTIGQSVREEYQTNGLRGALGQFGESALLGLGNLTGQRQRGSGTNWRGQSRTSEERRGRSRTGEIFSPARPYISRGGSQDLLSEEAGAITIATPSPHVTGLTGVLSLSTQRPGVPSPPPPQPGLLGNSAMQPPPPFEDGFLPEETPLTTPDEEMVARWPDPAQPSTSSEHPGEQHLERSLLRRATHRVVKRSRSSAQKVGRWLGIVKSPDSEVATPGLPSAVNLSSAHNSEQSQPGSPTTRHGSPAHQARLMTNLERPAQAPPPPLQLHAPIPSTEGSAEALPPPPPIMGQGSLLGSEASFGPPPPPSMVVQTGSAPLATNIPPPPPPPPSNLFGSTQENGHSGSLAAQIANARLRQVNRRGEEGAEGGGTAGDPSGPGPSTSTAVGSAPRPSTGREGLMSDLTNALALRKRQSENPGGTGNRLTSVRNLPVVDERKILEIKEEYRVVAEEEKQEFLRREVKNLTRRYTQLGPEETAERIKFFKRELPLELSDELSSMLCPENFVFGQWEAVKFRIILKKQDSETSGGNDNEGGVDTDEWGEDEADAPTTSKNSKSIRRRVANFLKRTPSIRSRASEISSTSSSSNPERPLRGKKRGQKKK